MKRTLRITLFAFAMIVVMLGCSPSQTATPISPIVLDAPDTSTSNLVKASGVVVPEKEAHLSFVIAGTVENISVKEGDLVRAGQELIRLDMTDMGYDVIAAEAALSSAEINAQIQRQPRKRFSFKTFSFETVSLPGEKILEADLIVEQRQFALEAAKASLAQGTLLAPFEGTVVAINIKQGEYVQSSQVVLELADLSNFQIETTDLSELDVAAVKIGQPATVYIEALDKEFPGKVSAISPISNTIGGDVVFKVTIHLLDERPEALLWGMSTDIEIDVE